MDAGRGGVWAAAETWAGFVAEKRPFNLDRISLLLTSVTNRPHKGCVLCSFFRTQPYDLCQRLPCDANHCKNKESLIKWSCIEHIFLPLIITFFQLGDISTENGGQIIGIKQFKKGQKSEFCFCLTVAL